MPHSVAVYFDRDFIVSDWAKLPPRRQREEMISQACPVGWLLNHMVPSDRAEFIEFESRVAFESQMRMWTERSSRMPAIREYEAQALRFALRCDELQRNYRNRWGVNPPGTML